MEEFMVKPKIKMYETCREFVAACRVTADDVMITNRYIYEPYFADLHLPCRVVYQEEFGLGEPSDEMAEALFASIPGNPQRVIAVGGGTIIDLSKLYALKTSRPVLDVFDGKIVPEKGKKLIVVPTTCGTGSEVTNVSVLALLQRHTKKGLAVDALYADEAVLIPELLKTLPYKVFATSSIDALVHAVESALSLDANEITRMFSYKAIEKIIRAYRAVAAEGADTRFRYTKDFLTASNYAGIAFGNAGCAAVHAMSYPFGGAYHVVHGESNYVIFTGVLKYYFQKRQDGEIAVLNAFLAELLACDTAQVYEELDALLARILPQKALHEYGVTEADLQTFTQSVMENQGRLMAHNFVTLQAEDVYRIYKNLF